MSIHHASCFGNGEEEWHINRLLKRFLLVYALLIALSSTVSLFIRQQAMNTIYRQARSTLQTKMDQLVERTDAIFSSVERTVETLVLDKEILSLSTLSPNVQNEPMQLRMNAALSKVKQQADTNDNLLDIIVYCTQPDVISTRTYVFTSADRFYDQFFRYSDWSFEAWRQQMVDPVYYRKIYPEANIYRYKSPKEMTPYRCIVYSASLYNGKGKVMALIPLQSLPFAEMPLLDEYDSWYSIRDADGVLLTGDEIPKDGGVLSLITHSDVTGMAYTLCVDELSLRAGLHTLEITIIVLLSFQVLLFIIFGTVILWQNIQPVGALMTLVNGISPIQLNDIDGIYAQISQLIQRNFALTDTLDRQLPIIENQLIQKWLHGQYLDITALDIEWQRFSLPPPTSFHWGLMVIRYHDADVLNLTTSSQKGHLYIQQQAHANMHILRSGLDTTAVLMRYASPPQMEVFQRECVAMFEGLLNIMDEDSSANCTYASVFFDEPQHAPAAFIASLEAAHNKNHNLDDSAQAGFSQCTYPLHTEERILHALLQRDFNAIRPIMTHIALENQSPEAMEMLSEALRQTRRRAMQEIPLKAEAWRQLPQEADAAGQSAITFMERWCWSVCNLPFQNTDNKKMFSVDTVVEYIMDHFADKDLSLTTLAEHFGVSEAHFSRFFKKKIGQNYAGFVETLRIKQSFPLLKQDMTIEAVADAVGYNSVYVFRTAFKRVTGATPSQFRK